MMFGNACLLGGNAVAWARPLLGVRTSVQACELHREAEEADDGRNHVSRLSTSTHTCAQTCTRRAPPGATSSTFSRAHIDALIVFCPRRLDIHKRKRRLRVTDLTSQDEERWYVRMTLRTFEARSARLVQVWMQRQNIHSITHLLYGGV